MTNTVNIRHLIQKKYVKIILSILLLSLIFLIYKSFFSRHTAIDNPLKVVETQTIHLQDLQQTIRLIGTIRPKHATVLVAKETGMLDSLLASGQKVKKGMLIAKIDNPEIEKSVEFTQASEQIAQTQFERLNALLKTGYVSAKEVEEKKQVWLEAQKTLAKNKIELTTTRFYAPFDGIVGAYKKREGTQVNAGDAIVTVYDPTALVVDFDIPCSSALKIQEGQTVNVLQHSYKVSHVQKMLDEDTHMCPADVDISCDNCLIGSTIDVELVVQEKKQTIVIPYNALFLRNSEPFVYIVNDGKVALVPVKTGLQQQAEIEIISGLQSGQNVIIKGQERLYPEMPVAIYQPQPTTDLAAK